MRKESGRERNFALDLMRVSGLLMMMCAHFMRGFVSNDPDTWGFALRFIAEGAPAFFFIAFGMTVLYTAGSKRKWRAVSDLGIVSLFHQAYLKENPLVEPDFLFFLWAMMVLVVLLYPIFKLKITSILLASAILILNLFIFHSSAGWLGAHPFGLFPWAFFVFVGMLIGIHPVKSKSLTWMLLSAVLMLIFGAVISYFGPRLGMIDILAGVSKWEPTTSSYLLVWTGIALITYFIFGTTKYKENTSIVKGVVFVSRVLLLGTCVHYYTNSIVAGILEKGGFGPGMNLPPFLLFISIIAISGLLYAVLQIMADLRALLQRIDSSHQILERVGTPILLILLIIFIPFITQNTIPLHVLGLGMMFSAFLFMRTSRRTTNVF